MKERRIALLIHPETTGGRAFLDGILSAISERPGWQIVQPPNGMWLTSDDLGRVNADCYICESASKTEQEQLANTGLPYVLGESAAMGIRCQSLLHDPAAACRMAFHHLLDVGFHNLSLVAQRGPGMDQKREVFENLMATEGLRWAAQPLAHGGEAHTLQTWLDQLPRPMGIYCANSWLLLQILRHCREHNWSIPEDLAIISGWHDPMVNRLYGESISGVRLDEAGMGQRAVALLAQLFESDSATAPLPPELVQPLGIYKGASTGFAAGTDPAIAKALSLIHRDWSRFHRVDDVAKASGLGRRTLEKRFKAQVGRTVHEEIVKVHMAHATRLLLDTEKSIEDIAAQSGYTYAHHFINAFKKLHGQTPHQFRKGDRRDRQQPG